MGTVIACIGCYCCLLAVRPKYIELLALLANVLEIGFLIWGIAGIPWSDLNTGSKVCYYISCALVLMSFILLIILMILRCNKTINNSRNSTGKCLCITDVVIDILAFIMIIISECVILYKMYDLDEDWDYWDRRGRGNYNRWDGYFSSAEWSAAFISTTVTEISILAHFYCVSFLYKLIHLKTDLSYIEYQEKYNPQTVNVYSSPPNYFNNNMTFLGFDKYGRRIYAGNDRYRTINAPIVAQPNVNQNNNINNVTNNTDDTNNNQ